MSEPEWIRGEALYTVLALNALQVGDEVLYHEDPDLPIKTRRFKQVGCYLGDSCLGTDVSGDHIFRRWVVAWRRPLK